MINIERVCPCNPISAHIPIDVGKHSLANEGELLDGESHIDSLSLGVVSPIRFSGPITNNNGFLYVQRILGCLPKEDLNFPLT